MHYTVGKQWEEKEGVEEEEGGKREASALREGFSGKSAMSGRRCLCVMTAIFCRCPFANVWIALDDVTIVLDH
ncbi:hypothetical protein ACTXT7_014341 [Hymenolepis weldensis]